MKLSLLKYSAWISVVCMLCFSCRFSRVLLSGEQAGKMSDSFLTGSFEKITCKAKVIFHENELSGIMIFKNMGDGNYKIAFYNELGMTYLEGTFENSSKHKKLIVKNISPLLNQKPFIKSFEKSMQLLFSEKNQPINQSSNPPRLHASMPAGVEENSLKIQLSNGFILELSPQITQINTE